MTVEELRENYDWAQVFADENAGNVSKEVNVIGACDDTPPSRSDVVEVIAAWDNGDREWSGFGVFRLSDGRLLFASGWCDYTGWD